jgi:hypothetical protein
MLFSILISLKIPECVCVCVCVCVGEVPMPRSPHTGTHKNCTLSKFSHLRLGSPLMCLANDLILLQVGLLLCNILYRCRRRRRSSSPGRVKNFLFSTSSRPALGSAQLPIQWVLRVKRPGHEADHSPPTSAEIEKCGSIHPLPHTPSCRSG